MVLHDLPGVTHNYAYFPVEINAAQYGMSRDELYEKLKTENIYSRRYFYPLCSEFPTYRSLPSAIPANLPVATKVAQNILCLPMFANLLDEQLNQIIAVLTKKY